MFCQWLSSKYVLSYKCLLTPYFLVLTNKYGSFNLYRNFKQYVVFANDVFFKVETVSFHHHSLFRGQPRVTPAHKSVLDEESGLDSSLL